MKHHRWAFFLSLCGNSPGVGFVMMNQTDIKVLLLLLQFSICVYSPMAF